MNGCKSIQCRKVCKRLGQLVLFSCSSYVWAEAPVSGNTSNSAGSSSRSISYDRYMNQYSHDVAQIYSYSLPASQLSSSGNRRNNMPNIDVKASKNRFTEDRVGKALYKAVKNPKKLLNGAAASAAFYGLDALGFAEPVQQSFDYVKEKTQFDFGDCGKVEFTNKFKAESCLMNNSVIELNSDYDLDSITLKFKWTL